MDYKYAILGNGIAGYTAAKEIRKHDKEGEIVLISQEPYETYYRIKISELIAHKEVEKPYVCSIEWYDDNRVTQELGTRCTAINPENRKITLDNGKEISADKILIALGASPFIPPIKGVDKEGVFSLRDFDDLTKFREYLDKYKKVTILGGGILGLEAAESLKKLGKKVNIIESSEYVMRKQLSRELGLKLNKQLEQLGYTLYKNKKTKEFLGNEKVEEIWFEDGTKIQTDAVLLSTGVRPSINLIKSTSIETNKGILVDEKMKTNIENIYAAGDIAEVYGRTLGLWSAAMETGKVAGATMVGNEDLIYEQPKLFAKLDMGEVQIFSVGDINKFEEVYKYDQENEHHRLFVTNGLVTGAILTGNTKAMGKIRNFVFNKKRIEDVQKEAFPFEK